MFGNDRERFSESKKKKDRDKGPEVDDDLESYLKERNATIGEETKLFKESEEDHELNEYLRLRAQTLGDDDLKIDTYKDTKKKLEENEEESIDTYLEERNKTMNDNLSMDDISDSELERYKRQRREIMDD